MQRAEEKREFPLSPGFLELKQHLETVLWEKYRPDGHWHYPLDDSVTMNAEYIFFFYWMGLEEKEAALIKRLKNFLLQQQNKSGGWSLYYGGEDHLSSSIEAYFALRLAGVSKDESLMQRAAERIRSHGGPGKSRVFTKIWLAFFELYPWAGLPMIPPEIMLSPRGTPFNIYEFSYWSRTVIIPLTVLFHHKKTRALNFDLDELYPDAEAKKDLSYPPVETVDEAWFKKPYQKSLQWVSWEPLFMALNKGLNLYETGIRKKPLRRLALSRAIRWIEDHQDPEGDWGGIMPAMMNSVMALYVSEGNLENERIQKGMEALKRLCRGISPNIEAHATEDASVATLQSCVSPVWDTALASLALLESGCSPSDARLQKTKEWIWNARIQLQSDWALKAKLSPGEETAAWCFQYHNAHFPDLDDTAMSLLVLSKLGMSTEDLKPGLNFIFSMQNEDGGWGTFDRENTQWLLNEIPFADLRSLIDPSNPDLTGHILECLAELGLSDRPEVKRAIAYLRDFQRPEGSWYGRWGVNLLYGTCGAVVGLRRVGLKASDPMLEKAKTFLLSQQNEDGGWGESCGNYKPGTQTAKGTSTPSQTAWALMSLEALLDSAGGGDQAYALVKAAIDRGIEFLRSRQQADGLLEPEFTATGFAMHFYLRYDGYRNFFPLIALGRLEKKLSSFSI